MELPFNLHFSNKSLHKFKYANKPAVKSEFAELKDLLHRADWQETKELQVNPVER